MTAREPDGFTEWLGYFLFHDRFPMSVAGILGLIAIGFWLGYGSGYLRSRRDARPAGGDS